MRKSDRALNNLLARELDAFSSKVRSLPGISSSARRDVFILQLLDSIHRVRYYDVMSTQKLSPRRADPHDDLFDPLLASILKYRSGNMDEACWLVFLSVHFGKHPTGGWGYSKRVYQRHGCNNLWGWNEVSADPTGFRNWLHSNRGSFSISPLKQGFSNHRKYQSLDAWSPNGTGSTVSTYVDWVNSAGGHVNLMHSALVTAQNDVRIAFDELYRSMNAVRGFGRLARFDYLTTIGKLGFATIEPGSAYMQGATGPESGARLLFGAKKGGGVSIKQLDQLVVEVESNLSLGAMAMQVMEDALCNWHKSPDIYVRFLG